MKIIDDGELRFLESAENVRRTIADTQGLDANAEIAKSVAVSIQQGRMFFQSAAIAGLEIRPLLLFYGMLAFARAVVCCRTVRALSTLSKSHGLKDTSPESARVDALEATLDARGTFYEFNDVVREQEGMTYFEHAMTRWHLLPTASSDQLAGAKITLKECLSYTPKLGKLYRATFHEEAKLLSFTHTGLEGATDLSYLRIDIPELFDDADSLRKIVEGLRAKYPMLGRWQFSSADKAWDNTVLMFQNTVPIANEFENLQPTDGARRLSSGHQAETPVDFRSLMEPICGDLSQSSPCLMTKMNGHSLSDISFQYIAMFLLSSLVRYRPQTWVHSVSRLGNSERPADDQSLALIERFMDLAQTSFPQLVVRLISFRRPTN